MKWAIRIFNIVAFDSLLFQKTHLNQEDVNNMRSNVNRGLHAKSTRTTISFSGIVYFFACFRFNAMPIADGYHDIQLETEFAIRMRVKMK